MPMELIDSALDLELSAMICGWDKLEKRMGGHDVIDMNLSDRVEPKNYQYRYDVLQDIERFLSMDEIKNHPLIHRKLNAHRYYLMRVIGEIVPFDEYLENTMGIKPIIYSPAKIERLKSQADECLAPFRLEMKQGIRDAVNKLDKNVAYDDFPRVFKEHYEHLYRRIHETTKIETSFDVNYKQMDKDVSTVAYITGDGKSFDLTFNMFFMKSYGQADLNRLSSHELAGHGIQFSCFRKKADDCQMPRYLTYVTVFEPVQFSAEGLAEAILYFYPEMLESSFMKAICTINRLRRVVTNNAAVMLNRGENYHDCVQYMNTHFPDWSKAYTAQRLGKMLNHPMGSSYEMVYSPGQESFIEIAKNHPNKYEFLASAYQDFLMPNQIQEQTTQSIVDFV